MSAFAKAKIEAALHHAKEKLRKNADRPMSEASIEAKACIDCFEFALSCMDDPWIELASGAYPELHEVVLWYDAMFDQIVEFALEDPTQHDGDYTHWMPRLAVPKKYANRTNPTSVRYYREHDFVKENRAKWLHALFEATKGKNIGFKPGAMYMLGLIEEELKQLQKQQPAHAMAVSEFFRQYPGVTTYGIAQKSGISYCIMRQYACGYDSISEKRLDIIEKAIHDLGRELQQVKLKRAIMKLK